MLETKGLVKIYKPKKGVPVRALDGVTLKFPEKGMVFLLGKSGSGKSTLLNLLGGLDKYDGGEIIIKNVSSKDFKQKHFDSYRNTYVGFIFQEYNILDDFTVGANIALAIELQGKKATDEELNRILHEVDLDGYGNRRPNELSGGQKRRVAIAGVIVTKPHILVLDEPAAGLDPLGKEEIMALLHRIHNDWCKTVIVVSHDMDEIAENCTRAAIFSEGKTLFVAEPKEIFKNVEVLAEKGLDVPFAAKVTQALSRMGVQIENDFTVDNFVENVLRFAKMKGVCTSLAKKGGHDHA